MTTANGAASLAIVLVEDNPETRYTMVSMARGLGHSVVEFENAEDALEYLRAQHVDVLVADLRLPGMAGEVLALEARANQPSLGIVFATGSGAFPGMSEQGTTTVLLRKPFGMTDLERALQSVSLGVQASA